MVDIPFVLDWILWKEVSTCEKKKIKKKKCLGIQLAIPVELWPLSDFPFLLHKTLLIARFLSVRFFFLLYRAYSGLK